MNSDKDLKDY